MLNEAWFIAAILVFLLFGAGVLYLLYTIRALKQAIINKNKIIERERTRTQGFLIDETRQPIARDIEKPGKSSARRFDLVTVLFSDIQGFTKIAEQMNPEMLIDELDAFFYYFDTVVEKYNIEKIKTIGDAYMCAGGIPYRNRTNPVEVILAALEILHHMKKMKKRKGIIWDVRIGIHTGSVIAGVVGHKKLSYDIWGDTVNTASRMESSGIAGKINISGQTYDLVKDYFECEYRGKMPIKYKGGIDMYFVNDIKSELAEKQGIPNQLFFIKLQLLRIYDLEDYILAVQEKQIPYNVFFHNVKNTVDLYITVELFGRAEEISDEDMLILRTAALFYNIGYIFKYDDHILDSIIYAKELLPKYKYTSHQINSICALMQSSADNQIPETIIEKIFSDARNAYLGRVDYMDSMINHFKELNAHNIDVDFETWKKEQKILLENVVFYTLAADTLREVKLSEQISKLEEFTFEEETR